MKKLIFAFVLFWGTSFVWTDAGATVNTYVFTQSMTTYTPIVPTSVYGNQVTDDAIFSEAMGFGFEYDGVVYSTVNIHSNGFLFFSSPWNVANYNPLSSGIDQLVISGCGEDLLSQVGGNISSATTGSPGNRVFTVQWLHYRHWTNAGVEPGERNFQIKLYESGGRIEFVYSTFNTVNFYAAEVGLMGSTAVDFINRQTPNNWSSTIAGIWSAANCALNPVTAPTPGLVFTFKPPLALNITGLVNPALPGCSNSSSEIITYRIQNNSSSPWDFSISPLEFHSFTEGPNPVTFPNVILNTGVFNGNSTMDLVVSPGTYNMSAPGIYVFKANLYSATVPDFDDDTVMVSINSLLSAGVASVSNDSICLGLTDTLKLTGANGLIQWQKQNGAVWENETGPGNQNSTYLVSPSVTSYYRARICGNIFSNTIKINVFSIPVPVGTDDATCGLGQVDLSASGTGNIVWYPNFPSQTIPVGSNESFEIPLIPNGGNVLGQSTGAPADWNGFGNVSTYSPNLVTATAYNMLGIVPPAGNQLAGTEDGLSNAPGGSGIQRTLWGQFYQTGKKYTFSVMAGGSYLDAGGTQTVRLMAYNAGVLTQDLTAPFLAQNTISYPSSGNNFVINSVSYIATPADQGKTIQVMVGTNDADGAQTFDKAMLTVTDTAATGNNYSVTISETTSFEVKSYISINALVCYSNSVYVFGNYNDPPAISTDPSTTSFCEGNSALLVASSPDPAYVYTWAPALGLDTNAGDSVLATPPSTTTYTVTGTNTSSSCVGTQTVAIEVFPTPGNYSITAIPSPPCTGGSTSLSSSPGFSNPAFIGTDSLINGPADFPAPFGNSVTVTKHQMLYRASDLLAAGFTPGPIHSLSFFVEAVNACPPLVTLSLKMGLTSDTVLTHIHTNVSDVVFPAWITPLPGWNDFFFFFPFYWDGVSSIIIETCNQNSFFTLNGNASMRQTATPYISTLVKKSNVPGICNATTYDDAFSQRINIKVGRDLFNYFLWSPGTSLSDSTISNPSAIPSTTTTYTLTIINPSGNCMDTAQVTVEPNVVLPLPQVTITNGGGSFLVCPGDSMQVSLSPPCSSCTFSWSPSSGVSNPGSPNPFITPPNNTNYTLFVTDTFGCTGSGSQIIGLYGAPPEPVITQFDNILVSSTATTYQWFLNGVEIPGATSNSITISTNGLYQVEITSGSNFCSSISDPFSVINASVSEMENNNVVNIYPNPFISKTTLIYSTDFAQEIKIELFNILGQKISEVWNGPLPKGEHQFEIGAISGENDQNIFFLKISGEKKFTLKKLVRIQ